MKITSYEISNQLAEAEFKAETDFYWEKWNQGEPELLHEKEQTPNLIEQVPAYDLETILDALPPKIARGEGRSPTSSFIFTKNGMGYAQKPQIEFQEFINRQENESLADTAAKLWLKLKKEGLV